MTKDNHTPTQGNTTMRDLTLFADNQGKDTLKDENVQGNKQSKADVVEVEAIEKSSFYFHKSYYEAIRGVEAQQQLCLWWAFMNYVLYSIDDTENLSLETIGIYELLKHSYETNATLDKIYE